MERPSYFDLLPNETLVNICRRMTSKDLLATMEQFAVVHNTCLDIYEDTKAREEREELLLKHGFNSHSITASFNLYARKGGVGVIQHHNIVVIVNRNSLIETSFQGEYLESEPILVVKKVIPLSNTNRGPVVLSYINNFLADHDADIESALIYIELPNDDTQGIFDFIDGGFYARILDAHLMIVNLPEGSKTLTFRLPPSNLEN